MLRVESVTIPTTAARAHDLALDVGGDKGVDNTGGMASSALYTLVPGLDLSPAASARLASDVEWTIMIDECSDGTATAAVGHDVELIGGKVIDGRLRAFGNDGRMPISTLWDPTASFPVAGWLRTRTTALDLQRMADGRWEGRVGMGFVPSELIGAVSDPLAPYFDEHQLLLEYLDGAPKDGHITAMEMKNDGDVKAMFAPDLEHLGTSFAIGIVAR